MRRCFGVLLSVVIFGCAGASEAAGHEPASGPFEGKTTEGYTVSFAVHGKLVSDVRFTVKWGECGLAPVSITHGSREVDANGHFLFDGGQWRFEGTFTSPTEVRGSAVFLEHPLAGCPERAVPYTATLRTGPPPVIPKCRSSQLKAALYERYPGANYNYLVMRLVNTGGACSLRGFPRMLLRGPRKQVLQTRVRREGQPQRVLLEPEEAVTSRVRWSTAQARAEILGGSCRQPPRSVLVRIPGGIVRQFRWHWSRVCQHGELRVTAFS
jgi:hypothetical protein